MAKPSLLPSFRQQRLLLEYATIKVRCPEGIYLTPSALNASVWTGIYFVRAGPYSSAILRFEISFPLTYPEAGPLITFSTEIFHPLLVPLTTYTFASGAIDPNATLGATESRRLPPGSFHLREAFPSWYGPDHDRASMRSASLGVTSFEQSATQSLPHESPTSEYVKPTLLDVLQYLKRAFEDTILLDNLPVRAAVNPNAWHAWRAHRGLPKLASRSISPASVESERTPLSPGRSPSDWNWDGVWESRVHDAIEESMSDAALFSSKSGRPANSMGGLIRFERLDDEKLEQIQQLMVTALGVDSFVEHVGNTRSSN